MTRAGSQLWWDDWQPLSDRLDRPGMGIPSTPASGSGSATAVGRPQRSVAPGSPRCRGKARSTDSAHSRQSNGWHRRSLPDWLAPSPGCAVKSAVVLCCPDQTPDHRAHVRLVDEASPTGAPLRSQTRTCRGLDLPRAYGASCSAGSFNLMSSIFQTRSENGQQIPAVIYEPHHAHRVGAEAASVPLMHRLANAPASHTPNPVSTG